MDTYGLIGFPLKHSFSAKFFTEKFEREQIDAEYLNFEIEDIHEIRRVVLFHQHLRGINVTIPYKEKIIPFLQEISPEAEKIGALRTHYSNPHGLPDPVNHFTTAYDLALIADAGFKIDGFEKFVSTPYHTVAFQNRTRGVSLVNTNKLLMSYPGANGVKTGVTRAAGRCLVASARRGDLLLIAVVLNGGANRFKDSAALLDYGFRRLAK